MRLRRAAVAALSVAAAASSADPGWQAAPTPAAAQDPAVAETVTVPGEDVPLRALLFRPAGAGPFPAVVALHGCAGLFDRGSGLSPRHADWARHLTAQGFLVLFPDSFGSHGAGSQCRTR